MACNYTEITSFPIRCYCGGGGGGSSSSRQDNT